MSTRTEFSDEDLPPVLRRLISEGRLRDYVLIELYATLPLSMERLVKLRAGDLIPCPDDSASLCVLHGSGLRKIHVDDDGLFAIRAWVELAKLEATDYLFPSAKSMRGHLCSRQARRIIGAQFHSADGTIVDCEQAWKSEIGNSFKCRVSRWPWIECVRGQSGEKCVTYCEGMPAPKVPRPFRRHGVLKPRAPRE